MVNSLKALDLPKPFLGVRVDFGPSEKSVKNGEIMLRSQMFSPAMLASARSLISDLGVAQFSELSGLSIGLVSKLFTADDQHRFSPFVLRHVEWVVAHRSGDCLPKGCRSGLEDCPACRILSTDKIENEFSMSDLECLALRATHKWNLEEAFSWMNLCFDRCLESKVPERGQQICRVASKLSELSRRIGDKNLRAWTLETAMQTAVAEIQKHKHSIPSHCKTLVVKELFASQNENWSSTPKALSDQAKWLRSNLALCKRQLDSQSFYGLERQLYLYKIRTSSKTDDLCFDGGLSSHRDELHYKGLLNLHTLDCLKKGRIEFARDALNKCYQITRRLVFRDSSIHSCEGERSTLQGMAFYLAASELIMGGNADVVSQYVSDSKRIGQLGRGRTTFMVPDELREVARSVPEMDGYLEHQVACSQDYEQSILGLWRTLQPALC